MTISIINTGNLQRDKQINLIIDKALLAVDPLICTKNMLELQGEELEVQNTTVNLQDFDNIHLIGVGKAVLPMASAVKEILKDRIGSGFLIAKHKHAEIQEKLGSAIGVSLGSHPIPSPQSLDSTRGLVNYVKKVGVKDLVISLISGGGSALMTLPFEGITITDIQDVNRELLFSGASINEMNAVRKHLDLVKGGGLTRMVYPARMITLVLSDVIGDALDVIASGPTVADPTTYTDALDVIERYILKDKLPEHIIAHLKLGKKGEVPETVKECEACLGNTSTFIIGSLSIAAEAALTQAEECGYSGKILTTTLEGEAREVGRDLAGKLKEMVETGAKSACLIAGGETTVTIRGEGKGGRNQELALSAALILQGVKDCLFISLATDGEDGPTDAAGAFVDGNTIARGEELGLDARDFLVRNDAYSYLEKTGSLIKIGPTGTNVNDLVLMFIF